MNLEIPQGNEPENLQSSQYHCIVQALQAASRMSIKSFCIYDLSEKSLHYLSLSRILLRGKTLLQAQTQGAPFLLQRIPHDEINALLLYSRAAMAFTYRLPISERENFVLSYNFHYDTGEKLRIHNLKMTPLMRQADGTLCKVLCFMSSSARQTAGMCVLSNNVTGEQWSYDDKEHKWISIPRPLLTSKEKDVLCYSAQGYTMKEMSVIMKCSIHSIKFYKRGLFEKLSVNCIPEALIQAYNLQVF